MTKATEKRIGFISGLKGYAAIGVLLIHAGGMFRSLGPVANGLVDYGKFGVVTFFFVSGLTITKSILTRKNDNIRSYLFRRGIRIIPLYYLILFVVIAFLGVRSSPQDILSHVLFINLSPFGYAYQSSILGVEWTIPIIVWFYILVPCLLYIVRGLRWVGVLLLMITGIFLFFHPSLYRYPQPNGFDWSLQKHLITYVIGVVCAVVSFKKSNVRHLAYYVLPSVILVYLIKNINAADTIYFLLLYLFYMIAVSVRMAERDAQVIPKIAAYGKIAVQLALLSLVFIYATAIRPDSYIFTAFWLGVFYLSADGFVTFIRKYLFENKFILYFGVISYAVYLTHYVIHTRISSQLFGSETIQKFAFTCILTVIASWLLSAADKKITSAVRHAVKSG